MKRQNILILLIIYLFTSSCSFRTSRTAMLDNDTSDEIVDAHFEKILECIDAKDKEGIKLLFSTKALQEADTLDADIESLFLFYPGDSSDWSDYGWVEGASNDHGHVVITMSSLYSIESNGQKYLFRLIEYMKYTDNPEYEGLYSLWVIKEENRDIYLKKIDDMKIAGIHVPEGK